MSYSSITLYYSMLYYIILKGRDQRPRRCLHRPVCLAAKNRIIRVIIITLLLLIIIIILLIINMIMIIIIIIIIIMTIIILLVIDTCGFPSGIIR